jgi:peptide/nickel transport system permease protein
MREYLVKRVVISILVLWVVATLNFVIFQVVSPIRPLASIVDPDMTPEVKGALVELFGLADRHQALLNVTSLGTKKLGWERVGSPPYLQKVDDADFVYSSLEDDIVDFKFENVTGELLMGKMVNLTIRAYQTGSNGRIEVWCYVPKLVPMVKAATINPDHTYTNYVINVLDARIDSLDRINKATFYLKHTQISAEPNQVYVDYASLSFEYGAPRPLYVRYASYIKNMFTWNFGVSFYTLKPVIGELSWRLPTTVLLLGSALVGTILVGIPLGILAASRRGTKLDVLTIGSGLFTWGIPLFFIQLLFMLVFSYYCKMAFGIKLFPERGIYSTPPPTNPFLYMVDVAWHLAMPLMALVVGSFGSWALYTRNLLLDALTQDYVVTARAKGLSERTVLYRHAFRTTLPPIVTMITLNVPGIVTGAMITEWIFSLPGVGRWYLNSLMAADYPVIQSILFIYAFLVIFANLVADLLYGVLDPRIRVGVRR